MKEIVLLLQADLDVQNIFSDLEDLSEGAGFLFLKRLDLAFSAIAIAPEAAPICFEKYRRKIVHRSGYGVFYTIEPTRIIVKTILNLRQDPDRIEQFLKRL